MFLVFFLFARHPDVPKANSLQEISQNWKDSFVIG